MLVERRQRGLRAPALDTKVELEQHLVWVWNAFQQLSNCRQVGMGVGPIPWTAIDAYATRHCIRDEDDFDEFRYLIVAMDEVYMAYLTKRQKLSSDAPKPQQPQGKLQ